MAYYDAENELENIFREHFNGSPIRFAEAIANGHDFGNPNEPFSMDSDVAHFFVNAYDELVSVHEWDSCNYLKLRDNEMTYQSGYWYYNF